VTDSELTDIGRAV